MSRKILFLLLSAFATATSNAIEAKDSFYTTFTETAQCSSPTDSTAIDSLKSKNGSKIVNWRQKKNKKRNSFDFGNAYFGFVKAMGRDASNMDLNMGASFEIGFEPFRYSWRSKSRKTFFAVGLSFNWRNYRTTGRMRFFRDNTNTLTLTPYPAAATNTESSRIKVFSVGIPFTYGFNFPHNWRADVSATLLFNTHATAQSNYSIADTEQGVTHHVKERYDDIHQHPVSVDLKAQVQWRGIGLYVKYSPCDVLDTSFGPKFSAVTTGLVIGY